MYIQYAMSRYEQHSEKYCNFKIFLKSILTMQKFYRIKETVPSLCPNHNTYIDGKSEHVSHAFHICNFNLKI